MAIFFFDPESVLYVSVNLTQGDPISPLVVNQEEVGKKAQLGRLAT